MSFSSWGNIKRRFFFPNDLDRFLIATHYLSAWYVTGVRTGRPGGNPRCNVTPID